MPLRAARKISPVDLETLAGNGFSLFFALRSCGGRVMDPPAFPQRLLVALLANSLPFNHNLQIHDFGGNHVGGPVQEFPVRSDARHRVLGFDVAGGKRGLHPRAAGRLQRDAFRLCSAEIPDIERVTACMIRNQAQLSPGCRVYFRSSEPARERAVTRVNAGRPLSLKPAASRKPVSAKSVSAKPRKPKKPAKPSAT
jgi:hypothetical protein